MRKEAKEFARKLNRALGALDKSAGRRVARRNARRKALALVNSLKRELEAAYPPCDADGREIVREKRPRPFCPVCLKKMATWVKVAEHMRKDKSAGGHAYYDGYSGKVKCACSARFANSRKLARHLAALPDVKGHFALNGLGKIGA